MQSHVSNRLTLGQYIGPNLSGFLDYLDKKSFEACEQQPTQKVEIKKRYLKDMIRLIEASSPTSAESGGLSREEKKALYEQCANGKTANHSSSKFESAVQFFSSEPTLKKIFLDCGMKAEQGAGEHVPAQTKKRSYGQML